MTRLDNIHPYRVRNMYTEVDIVTADVSVTEGTKFIEPAPFKKIWAFVLRYIDNFEK